MQEMDLNHRQQRFPNFALSPQVYPTGPGVQISSPHTLSVTSGIEHPETCEAHQPVKRSVTFNKIYEGPKSVVARELIPAYLARGKYAYFHPPHDSDVRKPETFQVRFCTS